MIVLRSSDDRACLLVVADGLGGHRGGALGAQTAIDTVEACWNSYDLALAPDVFLRQMVEKCHAELNRAARKSGLDPRSTLVALLVRDSDITSIHAGDSRVMQFSTTGLAKRTLDHSIAQLSVLRGALTEEQAATHPDQKKLYMHVGGLESPRPEVQQWKLTEGRHFVICSDGFWEVFPPREIAQLLASDDPARDAGAAFSRKLFELQRHDNTTALFAEVDRTSSAGYWAALCTLALAGLMTALAPADGQYQDAAPSGYAGGAAPFDERIRVEGRNPNVQHPEGLTARANQEVPEEGDAPLALHEEGGADAMSEDEAVGAVPLSSVSVDLDRVIAPGATVAESTTDELRERGHIGADDAMIPRGHPGRIGSQAKERLAQQHKGVVVIGAEVVVTVSGDRIARIRGELAPDIEVGPAPANDYPATVSLAAHLSEKKIETRDEDEGTLVIMRIPDKSYRWAWQGHVWIDHVRESVVFDAETGEFLLREPLYRRDGSGNASQTPR